MIISRPERLAEETPHQVTKDGGERRNRLYVDHPGPCHAGHGIYAVVAMARPGVRIDRRRQDRG